MAGEHLALDSGCRAEDLSTHMGVHSDVGRGQTGVAFLFYPSYQYGVLESMLYVYIYIARYVDFLGSCTNSVGYVLFRCVLSYFLHWRIVGQTNFNSGCIN